MSFLEADTTAYHDQILHHTSLPLICYLYWVRSLRSATLARQAQPALKMAPASLIFVRLARTDQPLMKMELLALHAPRARGRKTGSSGVVVTPSDR